MAMACLACNRSCISFESDLRQHLAARQKFQEMVEVEMQLEKDLLEEQRLKASGQPLLGQLPALPTGINTEPDMSQEICSICRQKIMARGNGLYQTCDLKQCHKLIHAVEDCLIYGLKVSIGQGYKTLCFCSEEHCHEEKLRQQLNADV